MSRNKCSGFTLIEVLIAVFILSIVLSTIYAAYTGTLRIVQDSEYDSDVYSMARMTLQRMEQDLGNMTPYRGKLEFTMKRMDRGDQTFPRLFFTSTANLMLNDQENPAGVGTIEYFVMENPEKDGYTLMRVETPHRDKAVDDPGELRKEAFPICNKLHSLTFKLYDSSGKEFETWDAATDSESQKNRTPAVVAVELNLTNRNNKDQPYRFISKFFLPVNKVENL